jgi:hypothetical protein
VRERVRGVEEWVRKEVGPVIGAGEGITKVGGDRNGLGSGSERA